MNERLEWFINNYTPLIRMNSLHNSIPSIYLNESSPDNFEAHLTKLFISLESYQLDLNLFVTSDNISNFVTSHSYTIDPHFLTYILMKLYGELITLNQFGTNDLKHRCTKLNDIIIASLIIVQTIPESVTTSSPLIIELILHIKALYTVILHHIPTSTLNIIIDHDLLKLLLKLLDQFIVINNDQPHDLTHINSPYAFNLSQITLFNIIPPKNLL